MEQLLNLENSYILLKKEFFCLLNIIISNKDKIRINRNKWLQQIKVFDNQISKIIERLDELVLQDDQLKRNRKRLILKLQYLENKIDHLLVVLNKQE